MWTALVGCCRSGASVPLCSTVADFFDMIRKHRLGRKRLLDTMLAATLQQLGIRKIITNNEADYRLLATLEVVTYRA